jgi:hypothetical protein
MRFKSIGSRLQTMVHMHGMYFAWPTGSTGNK